MENREFTALQQLYAPMLQALVELFHPFIEIALHDLQKGQIAALYNNLSGRKVGDSSPLSELNVPTSDFPDYFTPYYKSHGSEPNALKCTSITLRNQKGRPIGLICINVDVRFFKQSQQIVEIFLKVGPQAQNPIEHYAHQKEEQTQALIQSYLKEKGLLLKALTREQKKQLVQHLHQKGIFNFKHAVPFLAKELNISRASVYNYLKWSDPLPTA